MKSYRQNNDLTNQLFQLNVQSNETRERERGGNVATNTSAVYSDFWFNELEIKHYIQMENYLAFRPLMDFLHCVNTYICFFVHVVK